ncbi:MAG: NAD(P)H-hydrate dehydratase [Lachnospiraceae bacterium]|nr:NAD(P)H-hydrate dehydratase [Lachnospiraceae bacterium]
MRYVLDAQEMKQLDAYSIEKTGMPSMVLMERAALCTAERIIEHVHQEGNQKSERIIAVCGTGNNGGDAVACARILHVKGWNVAIMLTGEEERCSTQTKAQLAIARNLGLSIRSNCELSEYTIIIDGIFGIGLNREVASYEAAIIQKINESDAFRCSIDIPSGIAAGSGHVLGIAVKAHMTVTFGEYKLGLLLFPGAEYAGKVYVEEIGFATEALGTIRPAYTMYEKCDIKRIPGRIADSNKGTYGKVLIIAGSKDMTGAAYLSAEAAYRMGCGLVKVLTHPRAAEVIRIRLPEALCDVYTGKEGENRLKESLDWADVVAVGPGLSTEPEAVRILKTVLEYTNKPLVLDADALNILAERINEETENGEGGIKERISCLADKIPNGAIITPHLKELSRLIGVPLSGIKGNLIDIANECTYNRKLTYVIKDARTIVAHDKFRYLNVSGNHGMAVGGSGDVLTGVIAGLLAGGLNSYEAACLGVYIHGLAGDRAATKMGYYSMLARDMINALPEVLVER